MINIKFQYENEFRSTTILKQSLINIQSVYHLFQSTFNSLHITSMMMSDFKFSISSTSTPLNKNEDMINNENFELLINPIKQLFDGVIIAVKTCDNYGEPGTNNNSNIEKEDEDIIIDDDDGKEPEVNMNNNNNKIELNLSLNAIPQPNTSSSMIISKNNNNNNMINIGNKRFVVRLRGLPWSARDEEVARFFSNENIKEIQIVFLTDGRASGEALVEFSDESSFERSFTKNKEHIGARYIELFKSTGVEIDTAAGRHIHVPASQIPRSHYVIRMRGLPYSATKEDIRIFFQSIHLTGIHLIKDDLGRPSGEGYIEFYSEADCIAGMAKHRHHIEDRYIELFRSSNEELLRALGLCGGWGRKRIQRASMKCPSKCLLMRGLPYSCTESDITKFFQEIEITPIRIHRKADGAEAYVEFYSVADTDRAMERHRSYIGRRYIELFRVTYEDMARTVGLPFCNPMMGNVSGMGGLPFAPYVSPALSLQSLENVRRAVEQQKQQILMQQAQQQQTQSSVGVYGGMCGSSHSNVNVNGSGNGGGGNVGHSAMNVNVDGGGGGRRVNMRYVRNDNLYLSQQQSQQQLPPSSYFPQKYYQ